MIAYLMVIAHMIIAQRVDSR